MNAEIQDAVTLARDAELYPVYAHDCPNADGRRGAQINEFHADILHCRCFVGRAFLLVQDAMAVRLDLERV